MPSKILTNSLYWLWLSLGLIACQDPILPSIQEQNSPATGDDYLESIVFVNADTGYIAGGQRFDKTLLMQTIDGGKTWERKGINDEFTFILFDVLSFQNRIIGAGLGGLLLRSPDLGASWGLAFADSTDAIRSIHAINDSSIIAVGGIGYNLGQILRSDDLGDQWTLVQRLDVELRDVYFTDSQTGYACGYGAVYKSEDAGQTWDLTSVKGDFFSSIHFPTSNIGYAVGRTGTIVKTEDAGLTWTTLRNGNSPLLTRHLYNHVEFLDAKVGYILGDNGVMRKTTDGGESWQEFEDVFQVDLLDMHIFAEGNAWIVGSEGKLFRLLE